MLQATLVSHPPIIPTVIAGFILHPTQPLYDISLEYF
jgi:hypothetical protein